MRIFFVGFLISILLACASPAWSRETADSTAYSVASAAVTRLPGHNFAPVAGAGAVMLGAGITGHYAYPRNFSTTDGTVRGDRMTDILQYAPMALPWAMKIAGQPTRSGWGRMAVSQAFATIIMGGTVYSLKHGVESQRPDGSDSRSFPSGHSAWAFMGATIVAEELGGISPWYTVGAYTFATAIAAERVIDRHHFPADAMAGAGIGILAAKLGYLAGDLIFGNRQLLALPDVSTAESNFSYFSIETGLLFNFSEISAGKECGIIRLPSLSATLRGSTSMNSRFSLAVDLNLTSTPLVLKAGNQRSFLAPAQSLGVFLSPCFTHRCNPFLSLSAEAGAGYIGNMKISAVDNAVRTGSGSIAGQAGISAMMRITPRFSTRATVACRVSRYSFTVDPSEILGITSRRHASGYTPALLVGISSCYEF